MGFLKITQNMKSYSELKDILEIILFNTSISIRNHLPALQKKEMLYLVTIGIFLMP